MKKIVYADIATVVVKDIQSAEVSLLNEFKNVPGLDINFEKSEAMWIGSERNSNETPLLLMCLILSQSNH